MQSESESTSTPETPVVHPERWSISPVLVIFLLIPLFGIAVAAGMLASENASQTASESTTIIQPVPSIIDSEAENFEVTTLDGETVQLADYRGRIVFLNFWATWCIPCVRELPALQQFASEQGENGAVVLAVNSVESPEQINAYLADNGIDLSNVPVLMDSDARIYQYYGVYQLPTTYVLDEQGVIRMVKYGEFDRDGLYAYVDAIRENANSTGRSS